MQDNLETIKIQGILAQEVYDNKYFTVGETVETFDDGPIYTVLGVSSNFNYDSGFQGLLLKNNTTDDYVFAIRGTEINQGWDEFKKDLIVADIAYMGTSRAPQQMKDAMSFVQEMKLAHPSINASNTVFTGHSLGGSIAGMASYVYGFEAYTYNGFGINNMIWDADDTSTEDNPKEMGYEDPLDIEDPQLTDIYQTLGEHLESLGVTVQKETNKITNIIQVGYYKPDFVSDRLTNFISGQMGETHFVLNHTGDPGDSTANHKIIPFNESISIFNKLIDVLPDEDYDSFTEKLLNITPDDKQVERFLKALSTLTGV